MNFVQHIIKNPSGILTVKEKTPPTFYFFKLVNIVLAFLSVSYTGITLSLMTYPCHTLHRKIYMEMHGNIYSNTQLQF